MCIPVTRSFEVYLTKGFIDKKNSKLIKPYLDEKTNITLLIAILSAFIAGIILNFMPCILPVLLLKIVSLLEKRDIAKKSVILSATNIILGIFTVFLSLIAFIIILKFTGQNLGWGLHFQQPIFIMILIFILLLFACNILGWLNFTFPAKITNHLSQVTQKKQGYIKDFFYRYINHYFSYSMFSTIFRYCYWFCYCNFIYKYFYNIYSYSFRFSYALYFVNNFSSNFILITEAWQMDRKT